MTFKELPLSCRIFVVAVTAAGLGVLAWEWWGYHPQHPLELVMFLALTGLTSAWRVQLTARLGTMSVGFALVYSILLLFGRQEAVLAGAISGLGVLRTVSTGKFQPFHRLLACIGSLSLTAWTAGWFFAALGGSVVGGAPLERLLMPVSVSTAAYYLTNTILVAIPSALSQRKSIWEIWRKLSLWTAPSYYAGTFVAVLIGVLYTQLGYAALVFITPPLYITFYSYRLYLDKMQQEMRHIAELQEGSQRLSELYLATVQSLVNAMDAKDRYTRHHSSRVQQYGVTMAEHMGLDAAAVEAIKTGGLLHDVGKLGVPDYILSKAGALTSEEFRRVKEHPVLGYEILKPLPFPWEVLPVVRSHHERFDGKGYPDGLVGEEIPLVARILSVADVYDALTSERPYRKAWTHEKAVEYIRETAGTQFDPQVVAAFLKLTDQLNHIRKSSRARETQMPALSEVSPAAPAAAPMHARVFEHIASARQELFALYEIAQVMGNVLSLEETVALVLKKTTHLVGDCCCALYLIDPHKNELTLRSALGTQAEGIRNVRLSMGEGVTGQVVQRQEPMCGEDALADFAGIEESARPQFRCFMSAPLLHAGQTLGAITCYHPDFKWFTDDALRLLTLVAQQAANALQNAMTFEKTRESALTDNMTGLANSRFFFMQIEQEIERASRTQQPLALIVIDIDNFKGVNDSYGHLTGDRVLRDFANILRSIGRAYDLLVRYAGDEFFVLLPDATAEEAQAWVSRFRRALREYRLMPLPGHIVEISASVGVANFPHDTTDVQLLIHTADERMYKDKDRRKRAVLLSA